MGVCESENNSNPKLNNSNKRSIDSYLTTTKATSTNPNKKKQLNLDPKKDFILPKEIAKRDDVTKYYTLSEKILGEGASGQVCIGENSKGKFAIKKIRKDRIRQKDLYDIITEAEISMKLNHKNIMTYYEIYESKDEISYVMELGDMGDLFDFIKDCPLGRLPSDIVLDLMIQMLEVIDYLHSVKGIIHRDLKPENFMVKIDNNSNPQLKLIDFGLATYIPTDGTKIREFVGTQEYAAPEIYTGTGYNEKVDEWALGVVMFNMLTGKDLFFGENAQEIKDSVLYDPIRFNYIEDEDLRNLDEKFLNRFYEKRITAKEALEEVKRIKKERDEIFNNNLNLDKEGGVNRRPKKLPTVIIKRMQDDNDRYKSYWDGMINKIGVIPLS